MLLTPVVALTAATLMGASALAGSASAAPSGGQVIIGVDRPGDAGALEKAQYFYGGRNYCFYDGWNGPGYYWCGFAWRRGFGWGGPMGWRGWGGPPRFERPMMRERRRHDFH